jgi:predicted Zn-dependent protease
MGLACSALAFSACASLGGRSASLAPSHSLPQSTIAVDVANATRSSFAPDARQASLAMHHFLVGQLSLGEENFEKALKNFEKAEELTTEPAALIHSKLADLYLRFGELQKAQVAAEKAMAADPSEPYVRMLYAGVLEGVGREKEAEPIYRGLVSDFPGKIEGYLLLANLYAKGKNFSAAEFTLLSLVKNQPLEPAGHLYLGRIYEHQNKLEKAEVEYRWVFERDPNLSQAAPELVRVLIRQNKTQKAKAVCERILQKDPNNALARKVLSYVMIGESKLDEALQHLTALEALESDPSETRFKVALIQIEKQNYREAIRELNLVLAQNPKHAEARYYLASLYAGTGRRKEAVEELEAIDKESSMYVKARTFAAFVLRQDDDLSGALEAVDDALTVQPNNVNLILYGAVVLRDMGDYKKAEKRLVAALENAPDDERLLFNLALVLHERDKDTEALEVMERIVKSNPKNSDALNYVAYALAEKGVELERAEGLAVKAVGMRPNDGYYLDTLGYIYFKRGKIKEAEETLARAVGATGQDPVIVEHYVDVLLEQKKSQQAVSLLKSIAEQELSPDDAKERDKIEAFERLKQKLKELLKKYPELSGVQKTLLAPRQVRESGKATRGAELLKEIHESLGAS